MLAVVIADVVIAPLMAMSVDVAAAVEVMFMPDPAALVFADAEPVAEPEALVLLPVLLPVMVMASMEEVLWAAARAARVRRMVVGFIVLFEGVALTE
jgi:hypothetical protein